MPTITGFSKAVECAVIPGGPVGNFNVPGSLQPTDTLLAVLDVTDGNPPSAVSRTGEFSITAGKANSITNTTTDTTGRFLCVVWSRKD